MPAQLTEAEAEAQLKAISELKTAYQLVFGEGDPARAVAVRAVMLDLGRFCRAGASTFRTDQREHALLEGRREVWLHMNDWMRLPEEDLLQRLVGDKYVVVKMDPEDLEDDG